MITTHLFIDSSSYLKFYDFSRDDLDQLTKIVQLIRSGSLRLYVPQQVVDEFFRNREIKLTRSFEQFKPKGVDKSVPRFMLDYPEGKQVTEALKSWLQLNEALTKKAYDDALAFSLAADHVFKQVTDAACVLPVSDDVLLRAETRGVLGNPPGKSDSIGDQINWEMLLTAVPNGEDLYVVTNDGDYMCPLEKKRPNNFLVSEWKNKKGGELFVFSEITAFFAEKEPSISLSHAVLEEKMTALNELLYSGTFSSTHEAIEKLNAFKDNFSPSEVDQIFKAGLSNSQINWIARDNDVRSFFHYLFEKYPSFIPEEIKEDLLEEFRFPVGDEAESTSS